MIGKVEEAKPGKDGRVRKVVVAYKMLTQEVMDGETGWYHDMVMRLVRECIKLFNIEETSFAQDMEEVQPHKEVIVGES